MKEDFWRDKWTANEIGFHEDRPNELLTRHIASLKLASGQRICIPLCGKTNDIAWLLDKGFRVVGIELVETAIQQLFASLELTPEIAQLDQLKRYRASNIDIFVGNIFNVDGAMLGRVDAIYDRAALVALPPRMRSDYGGHLATITEGAQQLLISFDYDQQCMSGPPFSVPTDELKRIYGNSYHLHLLESQTLPGGLKGKCPALEEAWLLTPRLLE